MPDVAKTDPNFRSASIPYDDVVWYDAMDERFSLHGLYDPRGTGRYIRLPLSFATDPRVNPGVQYRMFSTSGGRIRFTTDSPYVAVTAELPNLETNPRMPLSGTAGIDLYEGPAGSTEVRFRKNFHPVYDGAADHPYRLEGHHAFRDRKVGVREIELYLPLYNYVTSISIGLARGASIGAPRKYRHAVPMVIYGQSVSMGGCASRPGNTMPAILSRMLDLDFMSVTFSGSCKGEPAIAEHIATLPMSVFMYDYDGNAPNLAHLEKTHEPFYRIVRDAIGPDVPVIMLSGPTNSYIMDSTPDLQARRALIMRTYLAARERGENVEFIDGETIYARDYWDTCTVDGIHPNDLGFMLFAQRVEPILSKVLGHL